MSRNHNKNANVILAVVTIGFLVSYPFNFDFWGKLISSGFSAAMIGGVADWFGVTALFRKPLGISFRTQIILKNRKRLTDSLVHMVENELLTKESLLKKVQEYNISALLIGYIMDYNGKKDISSILGKVIWDMMSDADLSIVSGQIGEIIRDNVPKIEITSSLINGYDWGRDNGYNQKLMTAVFNGCETLLNYTHTAEAIRRVIDDLMTKLKSLSKNEGFSTKLHILAILTAIKVLKITPEKASAGLINYLSAMFHELKNPISVRRRKLDLYIDNFVDELKQNPGKQEKIDKLISDYISGLDINRYVEKYSHLLKERMFEDTSAYLKLVNSLEGMLEKAVVTFRKNASQQAYIEEHMKKSLIQLVNEKHNEIGKAVRDKLNLITDEDLINTLEAKSGNDLQIIRINGSIVGGLVGMLLFLASHFIFGR